MTDIAEMTGAGLNDNLVDPTPEPAEGTFLPRDDDTPAPVVTAGSDVPALSAIAAGNGLDRRNVLGGLAAAAAAGLVSSALPGRLAFAGTPGDSIVVLFLRGAYDGMSLLAPIGDHHYKKARPRLALPASIGLPADRMFAWNPQAVQLHNLFQRGQLAPIVGVASPAATRSHFEAMERMESCSYAASPQRSGWLDRYAEGIGARQVFSSVALGGLVPRSMTGAAPELTMRSLDAFDVSVVGQRKRFLNAVRGLQHASRGPAANAMLAGLAAVDRVDPLKGRRSVGYPDTSLGRALHDVATLVRANLGLRVATVDAGGWDMHVGLGNSAGNNGGSFGRQAADLSLSIGAFVKDLGAAWQRTTLVVMSEFGRRVAENGSGGLDHGHGNMWLVAGGRIRGGKVYGRWPGLAPSRLDDGDLAGRVDHRSVLAEVISRRGGASARTVGAALPGAPSTRLGFTDPR
jgi:uncharacterized protein (DUF1501 family)